MEAVVKAIEDDKSTPAPMVTACNNGLDSGDYAPPLLFTVKAIGAYTFRDLFHRDLFAKDVIATWYANTSGLTGPEYNDLRQELRDLNQLFVDGGYNDLKFWKMVEGRVDGSLATTAQSLDTAIKDLMAANFRFPLFTKRQDLNVEGRLRALGSFALNRVNARTGGLGNMSFQCIFYSPAKSEYKRKTDGSLELDQMGNPILDPEGFSDSFLIHTVVLAHEMGILPETEFGKFTFVEAQDDTPEAVIFSGGGDECCCNNSTDPTHEAFYRTCVDIYPRGCTEVGGICVVGSLHCKTVHFH
ncbi:MAG: hypothetical protein JNK74_25035 [Candidatus Hydrogenedentes bacterium]|nr:hypothetical protein [Candidatus Hydrogenedentota bacterium]